jgi:hypothetical protein
MFRIRNKKASLIYTGMAMIYFRIIRLVSVFSLAIVMGGFLSLALVTVLFPINIAIPVHAAPITPGPSDTIQPTNSLISTIAFTQPPHPLPSAETNTRIYLSKTPTFTPSSSKNQMMTDTPTTQNTIKTENKETKIKSSLTTRLERTSTSSLSITAIAGKVGREEKNNVLQIFLIGIGTVIIIFAIIYLVIAFSETRDNFGDKLSIYTIGLVLLLIGLGVTIIFLGT